LIPHECRFTYLHSYIRKLWWELMLFKQGIWVSLTVAPTIQNTYIHSTKVYLHEPFQGMPTPQCKNRLLGT
jgi:hypothetical protein